ncbi:MAG TPA: cell division topological specificity factor MinE [Anaerolineaceae bacterium]|nr:cell division topological specificity factor MinE [Anaerolineaceae bacterium]
MSGWLERVLGKSGKSADDAKERLKLVLIHDRTNLSPGEMEVLKNELLEVISRHVAIDPNAINITMNQEGREQRLVADIPLKPAPRRKTR